MPGLTTSLAFLAAATAQVAVPAPAPTIAEDVAVVKARSDRDKRMTVPVAVQGQGPYRFVIDTGSQRTVLSTGLAASLALEPGPIVRVIGVAGTDEVATAQIEQFELGRTEIFGITAPLFEDEHIGADGIVGTDTLQDQRVMFDFRRNLIEIGTKKSLGGDRGYEIIVRARKQLGQLVMTRAVIDGVRTAVIIDTGAGISVGNKALQRALRKKGAANEITLTSVTGQTVTAELGFAEKLALRDISITNLVIAYTDTPAFMALDLIEKPALFLGMRELRLFKRVAIDFGKRKVLFDIPRS